VAQACAIAARKGNHLRIGIDARFITHPQVGGFKTYTESLVAALGEVDEDNEYVLYTDRPPGSLAGLPCRPNFSVAVVRGSVPLAGMVWREQVKLAQQAARDRVNLLHAPCLTAPLRLACPLVVTIHDMIWNGPQWRAGSAAWSLKQRLIRSYYRAIAPGAAARASAIITVSEEAKRGIVQDLGVDSGRVFVIHEAANPRFKPASSSDVEAVRRKHHLAGAFILAFGSADPRKNLKSLLDAYALLSDELRTRHPLVIVWTHSLFSGSIKQQVEAAGTARSVPPERFGRGSRADPQCGVTLRVPVAPGRVRPALARGHGLRNPCGGIPQLLDSGSCG
jgi:glycosyltransferase involved in cell wall biosynthesis